MPDQAPYLRHLSNSAQLVTTYEAVRAGFVALALERNRRATPYIEEARVLQSLASQVSSPKDLAHPRYYPTSPTDSSRCVR